MQALIRIRIILFALMIFGAFANFAQNEWGNTIIIFCQALIAISFIAEAMISLGARIKSNQLKAFNITEFALMGVMYLSLLLVFFVEHAEQFWAIVVLIKYALLLILTLIDSITVYRKRNNEAPYVGGVYEHFHLGVFFISLCMKNLALPGSPILMLLSLIFLIPFYCVQAVRFFKEHYKKGMGITILLTSGTFATILMGVSFAFKRMHWPGASVMFYITIIITVIMILGTLKWKYDYNQKKMNVWTALKMLNKNIILLYFVGVVLSSYVYMSILGVAPRFYSQRMPAAVDKYQREGGFENDRKADELREAYFTFIERSEKNGFLK